jgi:hypothetical protein
MTMAASIDPRYVIAPSLQMFFIDKDSALPLVNGSVYFYQDQARTIPKPVYEIVSSNPGGPYTYNPLPNPVQLSSVGTFMDNNNVDVVPYYYPYDSNGDVELYYIEVYNEDGDLQFTREAWPNIVNDNVAADQDITNFVPNGQFLAHNDVPAVSGNSFVAGVVYQDSTVVAPGGWTYDRTTASTSTDIITFPTDDLQFTGFPKYAFQLEVTHQGSDVFKDLRLTFPGVNTFASSTQQYNFYFEGYAPNADLANVQLLIRKYYGTGGSPSPTTETPIAAFTLETDNKSFNNPISFGVNTGAVVGTDGNDSVQLVIRFPVTGTYKVLINNFALILNDQNLFTFPPQSEYEQIDISLSGSTPIPDPAGSDLYLPIVLKSTGFDYDRSVIGQIIGASKITAADNELLMNGNTYIYAHYSTVGIPYSRLGDYLIANSPIANTPMYGTGANFVTVFTNADPTKFDLNFNTSGGSVAVSNGTSGFTNVAVTPLSLYTFTVPATPVAGSYFSFTTSTGSVFNVWYKVNSTGSAPVIAGTMIMVELATGAPAATVVTETLKAVNKYQYAILDARGYFWRGLAGADPDSGSRTIPGLAKNGVALVGANLGSVQADAFDSHHHAPAAPLNSFAGAVPPGTGTINFLAGPGFNNDYVTLTSDVGGNETRPINLALNWFIKY